MTNTRMNASLIGLGLLGAVMGSAPAAALVVDGSLADWGVVIQDHVGACGTDAPGSCVGSSYVGYNVPNSAATVGDTNDRSNNYVHIAATPGNPATGGGQNYDAQFLAAAVQSGSIFVGISSGLRPDNGLAHFSPGDLRILVNGTMKFGVEIGGGAGGGPGGTITEGAAGTTYTLDGQGHVVVGGANTGVTQKAGEIWTGNTWIVDPIGTDQTEVQIGDVSGGTLVGTADYVFTRDDVTTQHSIIEMSFLMSDLGILVGDIVEFRWGPSCANDLIVSVLIPEQGDIPAPAALPLFLFGIAGFAALRRRGKKAA